MQSPKSKRSSDKPWLNPTEFQPLALSEKKQLTHNTVRLRLPPAYTISACELLNPPSLTRGPQVWLRFNLPSPTQRLGLPIGQHISFLAKVSNATCQSSFPIGSAPLAHVPLPSYSFSPSFLSLLLSAGCGWQGLLPVLHSSLGR
jgi:hypothetical protein